VIGAFVDADWYSALDVHSRNSASSSLGINLQPLRGFNLPLSQLTTNADLGVDWSISVGGRLGVLATPGTLLYVLGAYTHVELDEAQVNVSIDNPFSSLDELLKIGFDSSTKFALRVPDSLDGFSVGGGAETKLGGGPWAVKLEYRWSHFEGDSDKDSVSDASQCIPFKKRIGIDREMEATASASFDDIDIHTVRAVLTYRFGGAPEEVASLK
jgi:opacity protein-like surface antigen